CFPWDETRWDHETLNAVRELIALRHRHRALRTGTLVPVSAAGRLVVFRREFEDERILVALNADSKKTASVPLGSGGPYVDALTGNPLPEVPSLAPPGRLVALGRRA
ncbi:MAG: alpha-glucosidase C-terminal domain-containing protein, partial [Candidatus Bipolaricaulota bacterium]|nr:alpha-glucosidase C-terminal domain-containing protein [Candidatus Bipolaricaulota bacterium]